MNKPSLWGPLTHPAFRRLWAGGLVSNLGTMVQTVGAGWLMATITTSNDMVALVQSATTLPVMVFSIASGALADSYDRRHLLMIAQLMMMATAAVLAVFAGAGQITPWPLLAFTFLLGCGTALHTPSWQASVGDVVPRAEISAAVTLNSMGLNLTRSVGPALGGLIVATCGAATAFAFNAVSFLPMIHALLRWTASLKPNPLPREDFRRAVLSGLSYVAMSPNLLTVIARGFVFGLVAIAILALLPVVARDLVKGGAGVYGLLLGSFGIGAIGGGLMNARVRQRFSNETIVRGTFVCIGLSAALVGTSRNTGLTCLALLPAGAAWVMALSLFNVVVQLSTPRWVVGRVLSIYQTASFGGMTAGGWLWGMLAQGFGAPTALMLSGAVSILGVAIGLRFALPVLQSLNLDPLDQFQEPALQVGLHPRSGPVLITVSYDIAPDKVPALLAAMTERRRIRLRDGARQWTLLRDLETPGLWRESYHFPTWVDYLRHNHRRTHADAEIAARLHALNAGGQKPVVQRMIEWQDVPLMDDLAIKPHVDLT